MRRSVTIALAAVAAMVFAASASAAPSVGVTGCATVSVGYAVTFSGTGFEPSGVVTAYDNGAMRGTTTADQKGTFSNFAILVVSLPSEVTFVDASGNSASVSVTSCGSGGEGGEGGEAGTGGEPLIQDDCRLDRYAGYDLGFKNQGACVSAVSSQRK